MDQILKQKLNQYNFTFKKAYGQNFLTDEMLLDRIVENAGVKDTDTVLEIGCGAGALTKALSKKAKQVIGYEIDQKLKPILDDNLSSSKNVKIVYKDIMKEDLKSLERVLGDNYIMVANLPYYITTPIVLEFLEKATKIKSMVIMVQEEVANRFCANAGTADYGAITLAINVRGSAKIIERVGREKFTPIPNVDSAVVKIDIDREKNKDVDLKAFRDIVRVAFMSRRKMLVNNIMNYYKLDRQTVEKILKNTDISLTCRGETLDENDFIRLSNELRKIIK